MTLQWSDGGDLPGAGANMRTVVNVRTGVRSPLSGSTG